MRSPHRKWILGCLMVAVLLSAACSSWEQNAFKTLSVLQQEYNSVQTFYEQGAKSGSISKDQYDQYARIALPYSTLHNAVVSALFAYHQAEVSGNTTEAQKWASTVDQTLPQMLAVVTQLRQLKEGGITNGSKPAASTVSP